MSCDPPKRKLVKPRAESEQLFSLVLIFDSDECFFILVLQSNWSNIHRECRNFCLFIAQILTIKLHQQLIQIEIFADAHVQAEQRKFYARLFIAASALRAHIRDAKDFVEDYGDIKAPQLHFKCLTGLIMSLLLILEVDSVSSEPSII